MVLAPSGCCICLGLLGRLREKFLKSSKRNENRNDWIALFLYPEMLFLVKVSGHKLESSRIGDFVWFSTLTFLFYKMLFMKDLSFLVSRIFS